MRRRLALSGALAGVLVLCLAAPTRLSGEEQPAAEERPAALVQVVRLTRSSLPRTVTVYGTVQPSASAHRTIMAAAAVRVTAVLVHQGDAVTADQPLLRLEPTPMAAATYAQAQSAVRIAASLVARTRSLLTEHLATAQQLAEAEKSLTDARASLAALNAQGAAGASVVRAPAPAIVTALPVSPGAVLAEGAPMVELASQSGLVLRAGITATQAPQVARGNHSSVLAFGAARAVAGTVTARGAAVDPATGLVPLEIALPEHTLLPGQPARASITTGQVAGYVVPHEAVLIDDSGATYVVQDVNGVARRVPVRVLASDDAHDAIEGALDAASPLVLSGNYQLQNGMRMRVAPAAKPP